MSEDTGRQDEDAGQENEDEGTGQEQEDTWTPPTKEDWEKAKRRRDNATKELRELRAELAKLKAGKTSEDEAGAEQEAKRWRSVAVRQAAAAALSAAGFSGNAKQAARLTRLLDLENAEPNRDGSFDFEDEVEDLKTDYPSLFGTREKGGRVPRVRTGSGRPDGDGAKDPTRRTTDALLKAAGYK